MTDSIRIARDAPLQSRNTFGVAATAPVLVPRATPHSTSASRLVRPSDVSGWWVVKSG